MNAMLNGLIGIIECGQTRSDWLEEHGEMADPFPPFLKRIEPSLRFKVYKAHRGELPEDANQCDAWLITGSPASVVEPPEWQHKLAEFLVKAIKTHPITGICYGHQLLHDTLGGTVAKAAEGWGVGVQKYEIYERPHWAPAAGSENALSRDGFRLIALHQDQVIKAAPNTRVLAGNAFCPLAVTTIGENAFTIQPHPEMTRKLAKDLYEEQRQQQGDKLTNSALKSLDTPIDDEALGRWILAFFAHRLRDASKEP